ncbi:YihY/virulence factor BrkB family protein [Catelliglobosispora koreensis]|uniref:YihY/virulence factor BrkB family protein n=1 Tax=Catelliglobosispora koreensis TaxID=129052 RepID=UPI000369BA7A|nr:YihY/virulence factor BrkB family protein [Catelliglobosispora koreensis]
MARKSDRGVVYRERLTRLLARGPRRPSELSGRAFLRVTGRTFRELLDDDLTDRAATLTYYGIMSIFPGMLVLVAGVGLLGDAATQSVVEGIRELTFGPAQQFIRDGIDRLQDNRNEAGIVAIVGLVVAFYSASGYVGAFIRAANDIYDVPEGRPLWKTLPLRLMITVVTGLFLAVSVLAVVFTGRIADAAGTMLGMQKGTIQTFDVLKWPFLILAFGLLLAMLYWAAPNARQGGFRWITPGSILATLLWIAASGGFAYYVSHYGSYDRIYGTLGGVIVFLVWMWITNVAVLLGAEFDAELARERAIAAGLPKHAQPYLPLRDVPSEHIPQQLELSDIPALEAGESQEGEQKRDGS